MMIPHNSTPMTAYFARPEDGKRIGLMVVGWLWDEEEQLAVAVVAVPDGSARPITALTGEFQGLGPTPMPSIVPPEVRGNVSGLRLP